MLQVSAAPQHYCATWRWKVCLLLHLCDAAAIQQLPAESPPVIADKPIMMKLLKTQSVGIIVEVRHFASSSPLCSSPNAAPWLILTGSSAALHMRGPVPAINFLVKYAVPAL